MRILIDVTETRINGLKTGIQRVVREVIRNSSLIEQDHNVQIIPVIAKYDDYLYELDDRQAILKSTPLRPEISFPRRMIEILFRRVPISRSLVISLINMLQRYSLKKDKILQNCNIRIIPQEGDILVILDSFWLTGRIIGAARKFRRHNGLIYSLVYDLIPITHPEFIINSYSVEIFRKRLIQVLGVSHGIISISQAAACEIKSFIVTTNLPETTLMPVEYFHLGADFPSVNMDQSIEKNNWPENLWDGSGPVFIMVGTIEPRKGHSFVLDVFEARWQKGLTDKLLIVGKFGWSSAILIKRIKESPHFGSLLFMINNASDDELAYAYGHSYACIMASFAEGFGLPLIEALYRGVPVMASDLPVFREIGQTYCNYFAVADHKSLDQAVDYLHANIEDARSVIKRFHWFSWKQSSDQLMSKIINMANANK